MSIASELTALNGYILDAYGEINTKGGTVPANKNMANLATAIGSISTGSSGIPREVSSGGIYQMPSDNFTFSLPANATDIGTYALAYAFYNCSSLTSVDLSSLTALTGSSALYYAFSACRALSSIDLSSLTTVTGSYALAYTFQSCSSLTSVDLSSLTTATGSSALANAFQSCSSLTSVDLSSLTRVTGSDGLSYAFRSCSRLTSVDLSSLTTLTGSYALSYAFRQCTRLTSLSFPALTTSSFGSYTNQFNGMLSGVRGCTVHFPASIQSTIGGWSSVTGGFGGTNTTVLFDL